MTVTRAAARQQPMTQRPPVVQQGPAKPSTRIHVETTTRVLSGKTASGNQFRVKVGGKGIDSNGNLSYEIKVKYEDKAGLFKGTNEICANATSSLVRTTLGKGGGVDTNLQQATASGLKRTGPNTFEGIIHVPLVSEKGKSREDATSMRLVFGELKNNSWSGAKFDGQPWQEYAVPLKLSGKR